MAELSEKSFPFDSEEIEGVYDRTYLADDFARYFRTFISSGVFMKQSTNLQVIANGDMTVRLMPGAAIIDGYRYDVESDIIIQLDPADGVMNRIDRISATWSKEDRDIHYTLQKGELGFSPNPPACRRTADCKDYVIADIYIEAGAISIKQKDITDQRLNSKVCGLAVAFSEIDTTTIFLQFTEWLNHVRSQGEIDIANLIDELTAKSNERYETYLADLRAFYRDIKSKGQQDYDDFNAEITAYIDALEESGDSSLAAILQQLIDFRDSKEAEFMELLETLKGLLDAEPVGHLQLKVDSLESQLAYVTEMLYSGRISTTLNTDTGDYITDDMGNALLIEWPICKCN